MKNVHGRHSRKARHSVLKWVFLHSSTWNWININLWPQKYVLEKRKEISTPCTAFIIHWSSLNIFPAPRGARIRETTKSSGPFSFLPWEIILGDDLANEGSLLLLGILCQLLRSVLSQPQRDQGPRPVSFTTEFGGVGLQPRRMYLIQTEMI